MEERATARTWSRRKRLLGTTLAAVAAGTLAWSATPSGLPAQHVTRPAELAPAAGEAPAYAVEDFNYPDAQRILTEQNIVLKKGDGHITLADCASGTGLLEVWAREKDKICFQVIGKSGWLTLEIPSVYAVRGNDYTTEVDMTVGTEAKSFDIDQNAWTPVGESADEQGREHLLVEIRSSK
ncbi:hypothetical protein [Streptomyces sp. NPDC060187]|uniref:hypothetical protein n=1 Tax=Streptomyces sp. NPDC060187 TaxID=3347067 RepID=UPI003662F26F